MKKLFILLFSIVMAGEMTVDGNLIVADTLHVTTIKSATNVVFIDSLLSLIAQLEQRIAQLECQNTGIIPDGYCDCFFHTLDLCGVCNGDDTTCQDCAGVPNGDNLQDMCGVCDNDSSNDCVQDCFGEWGGTAEYDACGECGGTCDTWCGCDGICEAVEDVCGVCGGDAVSEDNCYPTDIDGNLYETVEIGDQLWMAENLKVTHYRDGSEIPNITNNVDWGSLSTGAYSDYNNNPANSEIYGRLYNWYTVDDSRGVCPEGWHVPSDEEYTILTDYLGGESVAGGKMKETGLDHWNSPNTGATNESGFTGLPTGYRKISTGGYHNMGVDGFFWSSSESGSTSAWYRNLYHNTSNVGRSIYNNRRIGFSIRCLGD